MRDCIGKIECRNLPESNRGGKVMIESGFAMPGRRTASKHGEGLKWRVVALARRLELSVKTEVYIGTRFCGGRRRIDVLLVQERTGKQLGIECKYQEFKGTVEDKIFLTVTDIDYWPIDGLIVVDGHGYSPHMLDFLLKTRKVVRWPDLEDRLRLHFLL
jgi:hypothetical protein